AKAAADFAAPTARLESRGPFKSESPRGFSASGKAACDFWDSNGAAGSGAFQNRALSQLKIANRGSCSLPRVYEALAGIHRVLASMSGSYFQLAINRMYSSCDFSPRTEQTG